MAQVAGTSGQQTQWFSANTGNEIPLEVGQCTQQPDYKDTLERRNVRTTLEVVVSKETKTYQARAVGTTGSGWFKKTLWEPIAGTEKLTSKVETRTQRFEHTYDGSDSRRYAHEVVTSACDSTRRNLTKKMHEARTTLPGK